MASTPVQPLEVRVWDPLVRLFHWTFVATFFTAWFASAGEEVHNWAGYSALGLVAFRLVWGLVGSPHARFADFVPTPRSFLAYARDILAGHPTRYLGHNPAGGAMIVALLAMVALTAGSGWLMITDRFWGVLWVERVHRVAAHVTLILIGLHVLGVIFSSIAHRENLVWGMITGRKRVEA